MSIFSSSTFSRPRAGARVLLFCSAGCAGAGTAEITPLREEVAALRQAHEADRKRIESLEIQMGLEQSELLKLRGGVSVSDRPEGLPVVRMQPRSAHELPALPTATPVREPPPSAIAELERAASAGALDENEPTGLHEEADSMFKSGFEKLKTGDLVGAANVFHAFAQKYPRHPAADNAMLDEGIAYYGLHRWQDALDVFDQLAKRYPAGDAVPEGLWRSADCHLKLNQTAKAQAIYESIVKRYPASPEAGKATAQLAALEKQSSDSKQGSNVASTEEVSP